MTNAPPQGLTWYQVLGIEEGSSDEAIRRSRRRLQKEHHPDHGGDGERSRLINVACDVLTDPGTRLAYDIELRLSRTEPATTVPAESTRYGAATSPESEESDHADRDGPWLLDLLPQPSRRWTLAVNAIAMLVTLVSAALTIHLSGGDVWPAPPALSAPSLLLSCAAFAWCGSVLQDSRRPTGATGLTIAAALSAVLAAIGTVQAGA